MTFYKAVLLILIAVSVVNGHYGRNWRWTCQNRMCPVDFICGRKEYRRRSSFHQCLPDPKAIIAARLDEWNTLWNAQDFQGLENFYTDDTIFIVPGTEVKRTKAGLGFAELITGFITANKWGIAKWRVDSAVPVGGDRISTVDLFDIQSSINGGPTTFGREVTVWRNVNGVYLVEYQCINFRNM